MRYLLNPTIPQVLHKYGTLGSTELDYESTMEMAMRAHATDLNNISWPEPLDAHTGMLPREQTYREKIFPYWEHPSTTPYLHRQIIRVNTDEETERINAFCHGLDAVFIKTLYKRFATVARLNGRDFETWWIEEDHPYGYLMPSHLLLSEVVDFSWERRFFIVDGTIIDHSARIMSATPALPGQTREDRHHLGAPRFDTENNPVTPEPDPYVDLLIEAATDIARNLPQVAYTLDLGITYDDKGKPRPTVVETNLIFNSGFYWADVYTIWPALAHAIDTHGTSTLFHAPPRMELRTEL